MTSRSQVTPAPAGRLLVAGLVAGPLYLAVGLAQAFLRDGFVFARHPLSVLANGRGGWVQTANFLVTGMLVVGAAVGIRRALGPGARIATWCLAAFGASMILAAYFKADPMDGFPIGTPLGAPTSMSTFGFLHFAIGGLGFLSLALSCLFAARALARGRSHTLARLSLACGIIILLAFFGGMALAKTSPVLGIWIAVVVGWAWLAILSRTLYHEAR